MKAVGAVIVIVASYVLGHSKRSGMLLGERIIDQIIQLFKELKSAVEYSAGSMVTHIETCAYKESYDKLGFLAAAAVNPNADVNLGDSLCDAFEEWENAPLVNRDEKSAIKGLFDEIGSDSSKCELAKLDFAIERLTASLAIRRSNNEKHKGYYETLFTLTGIAVAILLI